MKKTPRETPKTRSSAPRFLVVIPAHNEEETIHEVVTRALAHADVSVTDDGSRDGTAGILAKILREAKRGKYPHTLNVITHPAATHIPLGIQDGMKYGASKGYDYIITMDAGLSHDPDALPGFMNADPSKDLVIGSRERTDNVPLYRKAISRMAALVVNYSLTPSYFDVFGPGIRDCTSGFRRYSGRAAAIIAGTELRSKAFDFHMEALAICVRAGFGVIEIPIHYVFSSSSFNRNVLKQAMKFALHLIGTKKQHHGVK